MPSHPSLLDLRSLPDPLLGYNFALFIPNIPVGGVSSRNVTLRCQNVSLPGIQVEEVPVALHGVQVKYAGRNVYTHTMSATFVEGRDMSIRDTFRTWIEYCRNARNNTGHYKIEYETTGNLVLFDDHETPIRQINIYGLYPQNLDDAQLDGSNSSAVNVTVTFSFDYHEEANPS